MTRATKTKKRRSHISTKIHVGVMTIRPVECNLNSVYSLLKRGKLIQSSRRFRYPFRRPDSIHNMILWKFGADQGGGSWKLIVNPER